MIRSRRLPAIIAVAAVLLPAALVATPAVASPGATPPAADPAVPRMVAVQAADFGDEAAELPPGLTQAIQRDVGISGAEYLANADAGDQAREVVDALVEIVDVRGSEMQGTELVVYVTDTADAAIVEQTGATAVIGEQPAPDVSDVVFTPAFDLRGGENHNEGSIRCTTGFVGTNLALATQILTAGHCLGNGANARQQVRQQSAPFDFDTNPIVQSGTTTLGMPVADSYQNSLGYDHGLIGLSNPSNWTPLPQITTWNYGGGSNTQNPLTIRDARAPLVGETACKSGATTGWTCGRITAVNLYTCIGGEADDPDTPVNESRQCTAGTLGDYALNGVHATICMRGGDSGGPVVIGTTAIGINSASSAGSSCTSSDIGVFAPLYSSGSVTVNNPYGNRSAATKYPGTAWQVSIGVEQPTLSNAAGGVTRFTTTTLSGTIPFGSSRHGLIVEIDGTSTFTPTVSSTGQWSVNVGSLATGRHTYKLQATWGRSTSTVATGSWLNSSLARFTGPDRYAAAANISAGQFRVNPSDPPLEKVFVATGDNFPDALAAGPVAASFGAPLLLTPRSNTLPASVAAELDRLDPAQIVVIGGTTSMPPALVSAMSVYATNRDEPTVRINGQTRYDVSLALLEYAGFTNVDRAWVVTGNGFADALSVSAVAAAELVPVILVPGTDSQLSPQFRDAIADLSPTEISIGGGPVSVSEGIRTQLSQIATTVRYGGSDRFAASVNINNEVHTASTVAYLANGLNYPDALAGGVVAGLVDAPLFIGYPWCVPGVVVDRMLALGITQLRILGGPASQSAATESLTRC